MNALKALSTGKFRSDIISGNLRDWIIGGKPNRFILSRLFFDDCHYSLEYKKTQEKLGDSWEDHPYYSYSRRESSAFDIVTTLVGDLPMVSCNILPYYSFRRTNK